MDFNFTLFDGLLILGVALYLLYLYGTWTFDYFSKRNIPFLKPVPFFGNSASVILRKEHQVLNMSRAYNEFPGKRYTGFFDFRTPTFMLRDPEIIRQIGVKDFDHFADHRSFSSSDDGPKDPNDIVSRSLIALKGQKWRDMRSTLSPAFTGSKMKVMYTLVSDCAQDMAKHLVNESKSGPLEFEMKDLFSKYTNDVIATSAFGIKVDSLKDPNNEFYIMGKKVFDFSGPWLILKFFGFLLFPKIMKFLKLTLFNEKVNTFFRHLVLNTMETREKENIFRPDMINLLMQARKGTLVHENQRDGQDAGFATVEESNVGKETHKRVWEDADLVAQAVLFFLAGFHTTSTLLSFAAHELAVNPEVQNILLEEIDEVKQHGTPTYESIQKLTYLDMVISESLRKWPPALAADRQCTKSSAIYDADGNVEVVIEKGKVFIIPIYAIHHDPEYYPDPERFDPERFSDVNKKDIKPFTYLPFGVGPRNCIGSRFALMEAKAILFHILSEFSFQPCSKTSIPLKLNKKSFDMRPENGFWLALKARN